MYMGICQHCKKREATHTYASIINGITITNRLCDECYLELFGSLGDNFSLWADILGDHKPIAEKRCPSCGMSFSEYERTGILGCPGCYDVFKDELLPQIQKIQGDVTHVGKVGKNYSSHDLSRRINAVQQQLETAVRNKDYAEADRLNRLIKNLTRQMNGGEND